MQNVWKSNNNKKILSSLLKFLYRYKNEFIEYNNKYKWC